MTAFPWYLLAVGIFIVIVGAFLAGVSKPPGSGRRAIDPTMRDQEIMQTLRSQQRVSLPSLVILLGLLCITVSIVWRMILLIF
jgi:hypothetical protein